MGFLRKAQEWLQSNWWLVLLGAIFLQINPGMYQHQMLAGILVFAFFYSTRLTHHSGHVEIGMLFWWAFVSSMWWAILPGHADWQVRLGYESCLMIVAVSFIAMAKKEVFTKVLDAGAWLCILTTAYILAAHLFRLPFYVWLNNPAADACMLMVLYPVLVARQSGPWAFSSKAIWQAFLVLGPLVAVMLSGATTPMVAGLICVGVLLLRTHDTSYVVFAALATCILLCSFFFFHKHWLDGEGRYHLWAIMSVVWVKFVNPFIGYGGGTFWVSGPMIEVANGYALNTDLFPFMHNDWLQILFEQGLIGFTLFCVVAYKAARRALDTPWLFASLCTYGFVMLTQFPLRYFASALIGAFLLRGTFEEITRSTEK